jgi:hypothetical protein
MLVLSTSGTRKNDSFQGQPKKVYNVLDCPRKHILFIVEKGAEEHCHCSAPAYLTNV